MKFSLLGYGKMGKAIEQVALQRGHSIAYKVRSAAQLYALTPENTQVAFEFSQPDTAYDNIYQCLSQNVPVVAGTTGWLHGKKALEQYCHTQQGTFFYAPNFSIGMNIFLKLNGLLAQIMQKHPTYTPTIEEVHHKEKKDAPSGTAISLAEALINHIPSIKQWCNAPSQQADTLSITAKREGEAPGIHRVTYTAPLDTLVIQHTVHSRESFALGAILVAEWLQGKKGVLGMHDFLTLDFSNSNNV